MLQRVLLLLLHVYCIYFGDDGFCSPREKIKGNSICLAERIKKYVVVWKGGGGVLRRALFVDLRGLMPWYGRKSFSRRCLLTLVSVCAPHLMERCHDEKLGEGGGGFVRTNTFQQSKMGHKKRCNLF